MRGRETHHTDDARPKETSRPPFDQLYAELVSPVYGYIRFRIGDLQATQDLTAHVFEKVLTRLS